MKQKLLFILFFISYSCITAQTFVSGKILNEEESPLVGVQIFNIQNKKVVYTNAEGRFRIEASTGDEIRILTNQYNRREIIVSESTLKQEQNIKMNPSVREIAGVNILSKSQIENMKSKIGVPGPPEKPREKVPTLKNSVKIPIIPIAFPFSSTTLPIRRLCALVLHGMAINIKNRINLILWIGFWFSEFFCKRQGCQFQLFFR